MPLSARQRGIASHANSVRVSQEFGQLPRYWNRSRWLGANNRYAKDTLNHIRQDTGPAGHLSHSQLASYIAASSAVHCMDGWSYAARAIEAELSGDVAAARHLAYYAEL